MTRKASRWTTPEEILLSQTRGEFLAACMLFDAEDGKNGLSVEVLSEPGHGATFRVILPALEPDESQFSA